MKDKLIPAAVGAAIGGALVFWWIKRRCPCSRTHAATPVAAPGGDTSFDEDDEDEDGGMFPGPIATGGGSTLGTATGGTSSSGGCSGCGGSPSIAVAPTPTGGGVVTGGTLGGIATINRFISSGVMG